MRYGVLFSLLGLSSASLALLAGDVALVLLWPALDFILLGAAYVRRAPSVLGKREDGTLALAKSVLFGPYLLSTWALFHVNRGLSREPSADEVAPGLWVGRRPFSHELPTGARLVVDLTAEFPVESAIRRTKPFLCVPVLDGAAPLPSELASLVTRLRDEEGVFLHCASGHGRSATIAAALLLARGLSSDIDDAERRLREKRPGIHLNAEQRKALQVWLDATGRPDDAPRRPVRT